MTKLIFKPEMFGDDSHVRLDIASKIANELLDKWLQETGVKVYSAKKCGFETSWDNNKHDVDTHQAILVCVEEIKKECHHTHVALNFYGPDHIENMRHTMTCMKCNKQLKPTGWEVV